MLIVAATCVFASANVFSIFAELRVIKYSGKSSLFIKLTYAIPHAKYQKCIHYSHCAARDYISRGSGMKPYSVAYGA